MNSETEICKQKIISLAEQYALTIEEAAAYYGKGTEEASVLQKTAAKLEAYLKKDTLYIRNVESLAESIRGLLPGDEPSSAPESGSAAVCSSEAEETGHSVRHTILVVLASVLACAAAVLLTLRARNLKKEKK